MHTYATHQQAAVAVLAERRRKYPLNRRHLKILQGRFDLEVLPRPLSYLVAVREELEMGAQHATPPLSHPLPPPPPPLYVQEPVKTRAISYALIKKYGFRIE